jgi:hypothetical protein
MGFLTGGPYYDLIGRTGNNVGRKIKGKNVFSMRPSKSTKLPTQLQLNQRIKFGLVTGWLSNALNIIKIGYQHYTSNGSSMNSAVKQVLDEAITGVAPNFTLDYSAVKLSKGPLLGPYNLTITSTVSSELEISWQLGSSSGNQALTDKLIVFGFVPMLGEFIELIAPVTRGALSYTLSVPAEFSGEQIQIWISFVNAAGDVVSTSKQRFATVI